MKMRVLSICVVVGATLGVSGCHVQVDKGKNGEDKNVRIETPLGGMQVRSGQTTAADLGLPVYPGAQLTPDSEGDKSADVRMGFGQWQMRVDVVTYTTPDAQNKVTAFYKNALGRFGDVLSCQGDHPVGTPTITSEGLTCNESHSHVQVNGVNVEDANDFTLRGVEASPAHLRAEKRGAGHAVYADRSAITHRQFGEVRRQRLATSAPTLCRVAPAGCMR